MSEEDFIEDLKYLYDRMSLKEVEDNRYSINKCLQEIDALRKLSVQTVDDIKELQNIEGKIKYHIEALKNSIDNISVIKSKSPELLRKCGIRIPLDIQKN